MSVKRKRIPKERNQFVAASLFRKAGAHKLSARKLQKDRKKINTLDYAGILAQLVAAGCF